MTIGLCPCWDTTCLVDGIEWGRHEKISVKTSLPAGKAFNVSRCLAWMGIENTAAGLWGDKDYDAMSEAAASLSGLVKTDFTRVAGKTRENITIVDTANKRDMHLRATSELATSSALVRLAEDLKRIVAAKDVCVFAGAMGDIELDQVLGIIDVARQKGARIVVDTSGEALRKIIDAGEVYLAKPNIDELCELLGKEISDTPEAIVEAGRTLLDRVENLLISRGEKGAILLTKDAAFTGRCVDGSGGVVNIVACGDYLLAGFLGGLKDEHDLAGALEMAIKAATARAWNWSQAMGWAEAAGKIKVETAAI